ncbi:ferritin-like domain-containing protein [Gloeothece verrucosa]|uniref:Ferritin-like domain-containing protein n=1 Tax=Gloeothece verrucosa (strain PCC 7822) TaxID=497965 RepID=E0UC57_GLOV7|nr:ferritin-like domain-containing protein [Gloeothece verrucosa]ADN16395.1 conserved hypothetical protein [Gloeothece verrucosa PCC 7822]
MKLGSEAHKELFCRSFMESHLEYEPETIPWPELDGVALERLQGIPFWLEALKTERNAGNMVTALAETIEDPMIREAIALQGREETRHARLLEFLIKRYHISLQEPPAKPLPQNIKSAFIEFGFCECLDSYFAFGMFDIARQAQYLPEAFFTIFDPILHEEARHIVFFVNWFTYLQINQGQGWSGLRAMNTLWGYKRAVQDLINIFGVGGEEQRFTTSGANSFMDNLTPELFFSTCLQENTKRMSVFEPELLRPELMPKISQLALGVLKLLPKGQPTPATQAR